MASLRRTRPANLKDITIQVAIVRPGPIQGGAVNPYIERRQRMRVDPDYQVPYEHPSLEAVLGETLGTIIFQDQVLEVSIAFAGFSPGEAEGLRRAMSRKRSEAAIEAYHERFVIGAQRKHGVDRRDGRAGVRDGPGLLRLRLPQGSWSRLRPARLPVDLAARPLHARSSCARCSTSSRWASTRPTRSSTRPSAGGSRCWRPTSTRAGWSARWRTGRAGGCGSGWATSAGSAATRCRRWSPPARRAGASAACRTWPREPARAPPRWSCWPGRARATRWPVTANRGLGRGALALWQLGVMTPGRRVPGGTQLALPLDLPAPPSLHALSQLGGDAGRLRHHRADGAARTRWRCCATGCPRTWCTSADLERLEHGRRVRVGGLVVARQRPGTASGVVFLLLEDEFGTINLIVPPAIYERHRLTVRTEPLMLAEGKLERSAAAGGAINVLVDQGRPDRRARPAGRRHQGLLDARRAGPARAWPSNGRPPAPEPASSGRRCTAGGSEAEDFRAVAPPVMSFASGRRR